MLKASGIPPHPVTPPSSSRTVRPKTQKPHFKATEVDTLGRGKDPRAQVIPSSHEPRSTHSNTLSALEKTHRYTLPSCWYTTAAAHRTSRPIANTLAKEPTHHISTLPAPGFGHSAREHNSEGDYATRPIPQNERAHTTARIEHETLLQHPGGVTKLTDLVGGIKTQRERPLQRPVTRGRERKAVPVPRVVRHSS